VVTTVSPRDGVTYDPVADTLRLDNRIDQPAGVTLLANPDSEPPVGHLTSR
jgi:hypothetical protein